MEPDRNTVDVHRSTADPPQLPPWTGGPVLVTGAGSRVGSRVSRDLRAAGADVRPFHWMTAVTRLDPGGPLIGDLADPATGDRILRGVDAVVHVAARHEGVDAGRALAENRVATAALLRAAARHGVRRFILISSYLVYPPGLGRPARESDRVAVRAGAPFGAAKIGAEQAALEWAGSPATTVLRPGFTYGRGDPHLSEHVVWSAGVRGDRLTHLAHHDDVGHAVRCVLGSAAGGRIYNVADDEPVSLDEVRRLVGGRDAERTVRPRGDFPWAELVGSPDPWEGLMDATAIRRELGFVPRHPTLRDALRAGTA